jgi:glycosyltransferase involved in cell wall biosynthesis
MPAQPGSPSKPAVSIVMAVRNEARSLPGVLQGIAQQTFADYELLVYDGHSNDGTREIVEEAGRKDGRVQIFDNPFRFKSQGLNQGIQRARADVIVIADGHAVPALDFLEQNLRALCESGAGCVGGLAIPQGHTWAQECFAAILSSWFGTGGARFRASGLAGKVDTVPYGAYRRSVFPGVGGFREDLVRNMDIEFNARLRRSGVSIYFSPRIRTYYQVRPTVGSFLGQAFTNGAWNIRTTAYIPGSLSWRHFIPLIFLVSLLVALWIAILWPFGWWLLAAIGVLYLVPDIFFSSRDARRRRNPSLLLGLPFLYGMFHLSYGLGSLVSLVTVPTWYRFKRGP